MSLLITNIGCLVNVANPKQAIQGNELSILPTIEDAFVLIEHGRIACVGNMYELELLVPQFPNQVVDAQMAYVLPAWCDSHTHIVFAGSREGEFVDKLKGLSYADIAAKGGGILNSAHRLAKTPEEELFHAAMIRINEVAKLGTGAIEIKSGYGLSFEAELKILRVITRIKNESPLIVKRTFLGAHAYPLAFKDNHAGYLHLLINEMMPAIASEKLADYVDVFCEKGFFSVEEMEQVCNAAAKFGLRPKLHINQLNSIGGLQSAINLAALSVDHLETMTHQDIRDLAGSSVIGTLLPTAAYFLRMAFQPAREMIDAGCKIAVASDFNPGSSPSGNMNTVVSMSCIQMKMLPEEAINAATIQGAFAMEADQEAGSIAVGKRANLIMMKPLPSLAYIPYSFGTNLIDKVLLNGNFI
ncbi:MAG: imidazolonepropionase [Chitinophagaceae bacterium]|nr:imidazolonepropionase [Bacteroidota bacterium]MCC6257537.1 imidazolonepropionase [Chitinophagaceae bacterium]MCW5915950.1 imidazolonepropionase [Ferruginibacter sp.]